MISIKLDPEPAPKRGRVPWWGYGAVALVLAAVCALILVNVVGGSKPSATKTTTTPETNTTLPRSGTTHGPVLVGHGVGLHVVQTQVLAAVNEYAQQAWCSPLTQANSESLVNFELDVERDIDAWVPTQAAGLATTLGPMLNQTPLQVGTKSTSLLDLATATAIVPMDVKPTEAVLDSYYCKAAASNPPVILLSNGQQWITGGVPNSWAGATATGAEDHLAMEVSYSLKQKNQVTYRHLWWSTWVQLDIDNGRPVITDWAQPGIGGTHQSVQYWAASVLSLHPQYDVQLPSGSWAISEPPIQGGSQ